ncbi:MAG: Fur family transcriptional regulator [Victivallaceae bacterium]|nr:Fur family transcriptional regulator [Victivallaceae bacterium]
MSENKKYEDFKKLCQTRQYKCTPQRFAVYEAIQGNPTHPSVDQIWNEVQQNIPSITRESVFRILSELAQFNVVCRMDRIVNARFDGFPHNHGHLICDRCGAIEDFELSGNWPVPPEGRGFQVAHMEWRLSGLCARCARELAASGEGRAPAKSPCHAS